MKLLIVTEVASIHAARWINQLCDTGWDIYIFQANCPAFGINRELKCGKILYPGWVDNPNWVQVTIPFYIYKISMRVLNSNLARNQGSIVRNIIIWIMRYYHLKFLKYFIRDFKPDIIHSHGLSINWENLLLPIYRVKKGFGDEFSFPWLYSTWGTDLDYFPKRSTKNFDGVISVLPECNYLTTECRRDLRLAYEYGFHGTHLGFFPDFGGVNVKYIKETFQFTIVSRRRIILLKGRDQKGGDPIGRAMTAVEGFKNCKEHLFGYKIIVYQADHYTACEMDKLKNIIDIEILNNRPYNEILEITSNAKIFISLTISDGLPSSLVEAMSFGVFPIHSDIESIKEIIEDGSNGLLVAPEDVNSFTTALIRAISDDKLVDNAAQINIKFIEENLSDVVVKPKVIKMYNDIYDDWMNN